MSDTPNKNNGIGSRRSQIERSNAMRKRLIEATLDSLQVEGYAGTTFSKIIKRANVSRGAPLHHFQSKAALIEAAADAVLRRFYSQLGEVIKESTLSDNWLEDIVLRAWHQAFGKKENAVLLELVIASRRDKELANLLLNLWTIVYEAIRKAGDHYLEPVHKDDNVRDLMILTQWLFRGMAEDIHLIESEHVFDRFLRLWCRVLSSHIRPKKGVTTPPPRPKGWERKEKDT